MTQQASETRAGGRRNKVLTADRLLALSGFALAGIAAFFPWYVFVNQESFGIRNNGLRMEGHGQGTPAANATPGLAAADRPEEPSLDFDPISTAGIPVIPEPSKPEDRAEAEQQPFPGRPFRLLHVANGQALIADAAGIYLVRIGSRLPDHSTLTGIAKQDGAWVIETSNGEIIAP